MTSTLSSERLAELEAAARATRLDATAEEMLELIRGYRCARLLVATLATSRASVSEEDALFSERLQEILGVDR